MSTPDQRLMDLGQKIIEYRNNADIKQEAFAKELGISRTTLSFIENGSQAPSFEVLVKLAQITNINFNELIDVKSKNIVVVDTNILLNRPEMLGVLLKDCDQVYIPIPVIEEINYQKDHGKEKERRNASLCEDIIVKKKTEKLDIHTDSDIDGSNDDKILDIAIKLAEKDISNSVYLLTNDKDFILKNTKGLTNLRIIGSNQYIKIFSEKDGYNDALSQRFFVAVLKRDLDSAKNLLEKKGKSINVNAIDSRSGFDSLIDGTQKILKYRLKAHNLSFERQIKDKDIAVICADSLVRSAIMNIVDNSIYWLERYKIQDKKICFMDYSEEPGFRGLLIVDNGKGFTLPTDKITLPFVSKKDDGMGLGLHLVSQIMETMGGKVLFPDINDFEISEEYKTGAAIALVFKEETKN